MSVFGPEARQLTLSEVARKAGLDRATARRLLLTLKALGYVSDEAKQFHLTPKVLGLAHSYLSSAGLSDVALPYMEEVRDAVQESCGLGVLDGTDVVCVARVESQRIVTVRLNVGERRPAYCSSMGRVLLAALPPEQLDAYLAQARLVRYTAKTVTSLEKLKQILSDVRRKGYCLTDGEVEEGLRTIAVSITNKSGIAVAALGASTHTSRASCEAMIRNFLPPLRVAANRIGSLL